MHVLTFTAGDWIEIVVRVSANSVGSSLNCLTATEGTQVPINFNKRVLNRVSKGQVSWANLLNN